MNKRWLIIGLIAFLILSAFVIGAKEERANKIEKKVLDEAAREGKVKVIIKIRDGSRLSAQQDIRNSVYDKIGKEKINHEFSSLNGFSASLTAEDIAKLEADGNIESVYYDYPVSISLQDSVPLINGTKTWALQTNGINLTGRGETICIIDTGVDYTHPDLGNCTPVKFTINGTNESYILENTPHPYVNYYENTWNITRLGYTKIGVHFANISTERFYDYVYIMDGNRKIVAAYSGSINNTWSPSVDGDTIYVRLKSDELYNDYGFYIDTIINGTTNTTYNWSNCSKIIGGWDAYNYDPDPRDDHGHGTHVTGIAAANGTIRGVAPEAKIIAIKALNSTGGGESGDVIAGIDWCVNRSSDYNISVISMSLGGGLNSSYCDTSDPFTAMAINAAVAKNISVIIASGNNNNPSQISYPACIQNATPVSSTDKSDGISSFSNRNSIVQLFAPGSSINSTKNGGGYVLDSGTSMATPHVAGAFAIVNQFLRANGQGKSPQEIEYAFNATGKAIYDSGSGLNFSRINIYDAVIYLDSIAPNVTLVIPSQNLINNTASQLNITFRCNASDNLLLKNTTFYIWNTTSVYNQTSASFSSVSGNIEINLTNIPQGDYKWNCLFYDINQNSAFAASNRSISYGLGTSNVSLVNPSNAASYTEGTSVSFDYSIASVVSIMNCSLIVDGAISMYNSSSITSGTNSISKSLSVGSHNWSINCTNSIGNIGNSSSRSITINAAPPSGGSTNSGGGGGGGGSNGTTSYIASEDQIDRGYVKELKTGDKIIFYVENNNHSLIVYNVGVGYANITISSDAINKILIIGQSMKLNLSSSYFYDLLVKLEGISDNKANITIKSISEVLPRTAEQNNSNVNNAINESANYSKLGRTYTIQEDGEIGAESNDSTKLRIMIIVIALVVIAFVMVHFYKQYWDSLTPSDFKESRPW